MGARAGADAAGAPAGPDPDLDPAAAANRLIADARAQVRFEAARRERRERQGRRIALIGSPLLSLAVLVVVLAILLPQLNRQTEDVAQRTSGIVGADVVQDAREARVVTGRAALTDANGRLIARGLPIVPDPGQDVTGDELLIQAARANVLADLPESTVAGLRREYAGRTTLPSVFLAPVRPPGDAVVSLLPIVPGSPVRTATPPRPGTGATSPSAPTAPTRAAPTGTAPAAPASPPPATTAPAAPRRGLFPLLPDLPLRVPLLTE